MEMKFSISRYITFDEKKPIPLHPNKFNDHQQHELALRRYPKLGSCCGISCRHVVQQGILEKECMEAFGSLCAKNNRRNKGEFENVSINA